MASSEIQCIDTRVVYQNRWMTVREDEIRREDGSKGIYGVVEKPDFAVIAAVRNGHMYLVEQYRYPVQGRYWELPQGSWEQQKVDPAVLAKAELQEETGLVANTMVHAGHLFLANGYSTQGYHVYFASEPELGPSHLSVEEQGLIARPFAVAAVEQMIIDGQIKDATTIAAFGLLRLKRLV